MAIRGCCGTMWGGNVKMLFVEIITEAVKWTYCNSMSNIIKQNNILIMWLWWLVNNGVYSLVGIFNPENWKCIYFSSRARISPPKGNPKLGLQGRCCLILKDRCDHEFLKQRDCHCVAAGHVPETSIRWLDGVNGTVASHANQRQLPWFPSDRRRLPLPFAPCEQAIAYNVRWMECRGSGAQSLLRYRTVTARRHLLRGTSECLAAPDSRDYEERKPNGLHPKRF